ncbi:DUF2510 domain-containing protein [Streptomyces polyrhachis]|uniref:DUF2510 domain-containing protein n=1 Tax=Streptomyces polyrhachis TaxID=1282885 RepID=A0ABW2GEU9_9ACTN
MSETSPAGWYPDPQRTAEDPPCERRWDGEAWTGEVRAAVPAAFAAPPPRKRPEPVRWLRARPFVAGVLLGALGMLVVGGGITGAVVAATDSDGGGRHHVKEGMPFEDGKGRPGPDGDGPRGPGERQKGAPGIPGTEKGYATDLASGISIRVPEGWKSRSGMGAALSTGGYECPADPGQRCTLGGVNSAPAKALGIEEDTAESAAKADIEANAEESYGEQGYGGITSHEVLKEEAVTVAGRQGYLVRWKVVTKEGDDGYVQSLAFPSPAASGKGGAPLVIVRFGFDVSDKAPQLAQMDEITQGIKAAKRLGEWKSA